MMTELTKDINLDKIEAIIFDFDGVLAESTDVKTDAFAKLFEQFGKKIVEKVVKHHIENGGISRYKKINYYYSEYLNKDLNKEEVNKIAEKFSELVVNKVVDSQWVDGVKEFLEKRYKKIDFFVASGTPQKELDLIIEKRNMKKYFKKVYGTPKTKPTIINKIISENKFRKNSVLFIGDSLSDYKDAEITGISFIGRLTNEKINLFPDDVVVFNNFEEILDKI